MKFKLGVSYNYCIHDYQTYEKDWHYQKLISQSKGNEKKFYKLEKLVSFLVILIQLKWGMDAQTNK
ncbi:hypothetical protein CMK19_11530 [Candidatus Poribacteria bacterium]|nr:hypothetical protein [Candidatus Poribacteria bacterium]